MIRPLDPRAPSERAYVLQSWRRSISVRGGSRGRAQRVSLGAAETEREQLVDTQRVALAIDDIDGAIIGWCCYTALPSSPIIHYVYVRAGSRRTDTIARRLLEHAGVRAGAAIVATSTSKAARAIVKAKGLRVAEIAASEVLR